MADCKVRTERMDAIYNVIRNLVGTGVSTPEQINAWFAERYPDITTEEIIDSLVVTSPKAVEESKKVYNKHLSDLRKWATQMNRLGLFLNNTLERHTDKKGDVSSEVKQIRDIFNLFQEKVKQDNVTDEDIDDLLSAVNALPNNGNYDRDAIESVVNNLIGLRKQAKEKREKERVQRISDKLGKLFKGELTQVKKPRVPEEENLKELKSILEQLYRYAAEHKDITGDEAFLIMERLDAIQQYYGEYYDTDGDVSIEAIRNAIQNYKEIRNSVRLDNIEKSKSDVIGKLKALDDPDSEDYASLIVNTADTPWTHRRKDIIRAEIELDHLRSQLQGKISSLARKEKVKQANLMGIGDELRKIKIKLGSSTITPVDAMVEFYYVAKEYLWELPRTLKFMLDNSAFFVQLSVPVTLDIMRSLTGIEVLMGDKWGTGFKRVADIWYKGFWKVIQSDYISAGANPRGMLKAKEASGIWVREKYDEILNSDLYDLMDKAGLKISRSKSMTDSEEFFKTNLVNKVPFAGWLKDVSEDVMVTTLNMYRVSMFQSFYDMHPDLTVEEYKKAAEAINNLTGTTNKGGQTLSSLAYFLSAPRLLVAKLKTAFIFPANIIFGLDLKGSAKDKTLKYLSAYQAYLARQMGGLLTSYALIFGALSALGGSISGGADWEEKDFMRIRVGDTTYDMTGGIGALYRLVSLMIKLVAGTDDEDSQNLKDRIVYLQNVKGLDLIGALLNFERTKLHPTITTTASVITGKDFQGNAYSSTPAKSRMEAAARALMPISMEGVIDDYEQAYMDMITEDPEKADAYFDAFGRMLSDVDSFINVLLEVHGVSTYTSGTGSHVMVDRTIERTGYKPDMRYPKELNERRGKKVKDSLRKKYLQQRYKLMYNNALGEFILANPDMDEREFKIKWKSQVRNVEKDFDELYGDVVNELELETK